MTQYLYLQTTSFGTKAEKLRRIWEPTYVIMYRNGPECSSSSRGEEVDIFFDLLILFYVPLTYNWNIYPIHNLLNLLWSLWFMKLCLIPHSKAIFPPIIYNWNIYIPYLQFIESDSFCLMGQFSKSKEKGQKNNLQY